MKEFIYRGKTLPDLLRFSKKEIVVKGILIKFMPKENKTFLEVHYKTELSEEEAKKEIENILDAWAKEMSLKHRLDIKYTESSFGPKGGIMKGISNIRCHVAIAKNNIDPTPEYTDTINSFDYIKEALSLFIKSLSAKNPFSYHYMICEAIEKLCEEENICKSDIKYCSVMRELANRYRHHKSKLPPPSAKCKDLLAFPRSKQIDKVRGHSKEIIQNCITYLRRYS